MPAPADFDIVELVRALAAQLEALALRVTALETTVGTGLETAVGAGLAPAPKEPKIKKPAA